MRVLTVYARLYGRCFEEALRGIGKNPWTLLLPMVLWFGLQLVIGLVAGAVPGLVAGIIIGLLTDAVLSSYFYFVGEIVGKQKVSVREFGRSFGAYFWSILNLLFVFWIVQWILSLVLRNSPQGGVILSGLMVVAAIALNVVFEVIYIKGSFGGLQTIQANWEFIKANWIEWFVPNVPLLLLFLFVSSAVGTVGGPIASAIVGGALIHVLMVFRGFLFRELDGSSHRQRMFRYRNQG